MKWVSKVILALPGCICGSNIAMADLVTDVRSADLKPRAHAVLFAPVQEKGPTLDGSLDEEVWRNAALINAWSDFPSGAPVSIDSELRVTADKQFLYVGWIMRGTKHLKLKQPKGGDEYGGGLLEIFVDPNCKGRTKVQMVTNPLGMRYDAYDRRKDWTGSWQSVGKVHEDSWVVEVAIPADELNNRYIGHRQYWKANFGIVYYDGNGEHMQSWTGRWGDPAADYGTIFFGTREKYEQSLRPRMWIYLDRAVYDVNESTAVALVRFDGAGQLIDKLGLRVVAKGGNKVVAQQTIDSIPGQEIDLTLDFSDLVEGDYELRFELLRGDTVVADRGVPFTKEARNLLPIGKTSGKISIRVHPQPELPGIDFPMTTGVPFAYGALKSPENVRLIGPDGKQVPVQTVVRSRWSPAGSIRWLGLDLAPTLADKEQVYTLEYGPDVHGAVTSSLKVDEQADAIHVNTGPLQFTVNRKRFNLIEAATINGKPVILPGAGGLSLVDHEGNRYVSSLDHAAEVVVEETGPVRTTIRATGWYVKQGSDGSRTSVELPTDRLCKFTLRLSAFTGSPMLKCAVSTTMTFDSSKVRLRELTIGLPVGSNRKIKLGTANGVVDLGGEGYLLTDRWDRSVDHDGKEHARGEGWIEASDGATTIAVAMRRFWQLFPKEIGYHGGVLTFHPWPAHGRDVFAMEDQTQMQNIYKLWWAHHGRELDFTFPAEYKKTIDDYLAANPKAFSPYYKAMDYANAQGLTVHNDLLIAFSADAEPSPSGETLCELVNTDPHALPDTEYACATWAMGPMLHADPAYAALDETFKRGFQSLTTRTKPNNEYGMFIHGNMHTYWRYSGNTGRAGIHRVWMNGHYQVARMPFVQYFRTADPTWMGWGRDHANALRDIGMVHYISDDRRFQYHQLGAMYHCKGFAPWAGDAHLAAHPLCIDFLLYDYFLTGNGRSRDALGNWIAGLKNQAPGGFGTREGINSLSEIIEVYSHTWDAGLLEIIDRFRNAIFRQPLQDQGNWDYNNLLFFRDYLLTGSEQTLAAFRSALASRSPGSGTTAGGSMHYDGFLAQLDSDPDRLKLWPDRLYRTATSVIDRNGDFSDGFTHHMWISYVYVVHKYPYLLKGMKHFGVNIERPRITRPARIGHVDGRTILAVNESADRAFDVTIAAARAPRGDISVRVIREDGVEVAGGKRPKLDKDTENLPLRLTVPNDGQAAQYTIVIDRSYGYEPLQWPVTDLKHEVMVAPPGSRLDLLAGPAGVRLYFNPPPGGIRNLTVRSNVKTAMGLELLDASDNVIDRASASRYVGQTDAVDVPAPPEANGPLSFYLS